MSEVKDKIHQAIEKGAETSEYLRTYIQLQIQLRKLELAKMAGRTTSAITEAIVGGVIFLIAFVFALIALAIWLGSVVDSRALGYLIVAGILLLVFGLFHLVKKQLITRPASKMASEKLFHQGLPKDSEVELKRKIAVLKTLLEESSQEIPESLKDLSVKDLLPKPKEVISEIGFVKAFKRLIPGSKKKGNTSMYEDEWREKGDDLFRKK